MPVDYNALAKQAGAISSGPPAAKSVDYGALAKQAGAISSESAVPPQAAEEQPGAISRFFSAVGDAINPIPAIKEYLDRPSEWKKISDGMGVATASRGREMTPEESEIVERGLQANVGNPMGQVLPAGSETAVQAAEQARQGNVAGAAGTLVGGYAIPAAIGVGLSKPGRQAIARGTTAAVEKSKTAVLGPPDPVRQMTQALKPSSTKIHFAQDLNRAMPELKVSEQALGRPIANVDDLLEATKIAKQRVRTQLDDMMGPQRLQNIDATPVAVAMEKSIPAKLKLQDPVAAAKIIETANKYRGVFKLEDLEQLLQDSNAELAAYYAKYPTAQRNALRSNPETAQIAAHADAVRKLIYDTLDEPGQGAAPREIQRRYGALLSTEHEVYRRKVTAERQAPEGLAQQASKLHAAGKLARAGFRAMHGDVLGASLDISEGMAVRRAADWLREQNSTNGLIRRSFEGYTGQPAPVATPPKFKPKGLLTEGSIKTPPPADPSGITVTTGPPLQPKIKGLLGPGPILTPPPADPSGITLSQLVRGVAKDPKTGRMFEYYSSDPRK